MKIVVVMGKRKLNVNKTAFRKARDKNEPYFIAFFHPEETKIDIRKTRNDRFKKSNILPVSKYDPKKKHDYYLPFQRYDTRRQ